MHALFRFMVRFTISCPGYGSCFVNFDEVMVTLYDN